MHHRLRMGKALYTYFRGIYGMMPNDGKAGELMTNRQAKKRKNRKMLERRKEKKQDVTQA